MPWCAIAGWQKIRRSCIPCSPWPICTRRDLDCWPPRKGASGTRESRQESWQTSDFSTLSTCSSIIFRSSPSQSHHCAASANNFALDQSFPSCSRIRIAQISFNFRGGFWPSSLPLFHGVTRPFVVVAVSMSCSYVERKESHVDLGLKALHDPLQSIDCAQC